MRSVARAAVSRAIRAGYRRPQQQAVSADQPLGLASSAMSARFQIVRRCLGQVGEATHSLDGQAAVDLPQEHATAREINAQPLRGRGEWQ